MKKILVYGLTNHWGGVQAIVMAMIQRLSKENKFDIIQSPDESSFENNYIDYPNIRFIHMPSWGSNRKDFSESLMNLYKEQDYNYLWINGNIIANKAIVSVTKKYSKAKIITHSHGSSFECNNKIKWIILLALHKLNRNYYEANIDSPCMCSISSGKWYYGEKYLKQHEVHYIKNGIIKEKFIYNEEIREECRKELGVNRKFVLFHAGRLTEVKNQRKILNIFSEFLSHGVDSVLLIAGEGELLNELTMLAKKLKIEDKVIFLGNRNDVHRLYQAADVMLLPSFHEGFPVTLVEAQAAGLPCLVSDRVSEETNINGDVRYLSIDDNTNEEWIKSLVDIFKKKNNRKEKGEKVFNKGFDIEDVCKKFMEFIQR